MRTKIVTVIPIARGIGKDTLTYYTTKEVSPGMLVSVPLRKKNAHALVVGTEDVMLSKSELKASSFRLKKITSAKKGGIVLPKFMRAAEKSALYFAASTGAVLAQLIPRAALAHAESLDAPPEAARPRDITKTPLPDTPLQYEKCIFQTPEEERLATYRSVIREEFAKQSSVFVVVPTREDADYVARSLERGIEQYVFVLHGGLSATELRAKWNEAVATDHPVLIVAPGGFLSIPRTDIKMFILEQEHSSFYKLPRRPFLDIRTTVEHVAEECGARLIFGDIFLRTETLHRAERGELQEFAPTKWRVLSDAENAMRDMRSYKNIAGREKFELLSRELKTIIENESRNGEHVLLFAARRGLYPATVCGDCGATALCVRCKTPVVLHQRAGFAGKRGRVFVCHTCGAERGAEDVCAQCGSWRLTPLGIGTERIEEAARALAPDDTLVLRFDGDSAKTPKRAKNILKEFASAPRAILVATSMVLPYLHQTVPHVAVVSADALCALPDFKIHEKVFHTLISLRNRAEKTFTIQTRAADTPLFNQALQGNLIEFYRNERALRRQFSYPPFSVLIKITRRGTRQTVERDMENLKKLFEEYDPAIYPAFTEEARGNYIMHALIRVDKNAWPNDNLSTRLKSLPPSFVVEVEPESIL